MAYIKFIIVLTIITIVSPSIVVATEHIVGDGSGWTGNFDYQAWTKNKTFYVGDTLVFKYKLGSHTVFEVNAAGFQGCVVPSFQEAKASGNDVFTLTSPGEKWYICGMIPNHCATLGMKLAITVRERTTPPLAPTPRAALAPTPSSALAPTTSSTPAMLTSWFQVFATGLVAVFVVVFG